MSRIMFVAPLLALAVLLSLQSDATAVSLKAEDVKFLDNNEDIIDATEYIFLLEHGISRGEIQSQVERMGVEKLLKKASATSVATPSRASASSATAGKATYTQGGYAFTNPVVSGNTITMDVVFGQKTNPAVFTVVWNQIGKYQDMSRKTFPRIIIEGRFTLADVWELKNNPRKTQAQVICAASEAVDMANMIAKWFHDDLANWCASNGIPFIPRPVGFDIVPMGSMGKPLDNEMVATLRNNQVVLHLP